MNESITIERFLGLSNIKINIHPLTVLIGPQATGKSVIAKLCFFSKGILNDVFTAIENDQTKQDLAKTLTAKFLEYFPSTCWGPESFSVTYRIGNERITIKKGSGKNAKLRITYPEFFDDALDTFRAEFKDRLSKQTDQDEYFRKFNVMHEIRAELQKSATRHFGNEIAFRQLFIPAGRSFFANLQSSIFTFLSSNNAVDPFLKEFGSFYENIKNWTRHIDGDDKREKPHYIQSKKLSESILCGSYLNEKGKDFLDLTDGRRISLANCSSGQQEVLPLSLILRALPLLGNPGVSIYIEEPEAHLFPTAQRKVLEMIALVFNSMEPRLQTVITTHSPYILTALNNLVEAGRLHQMKLKPASKARLNAVVSQELALAPNRVGAYSVSVGGVQSISDPDTGMINARAIDSASEEIAVQFDKLLAIENR